MSLHNRSLYNSPFFRSVSLKRQATQTERMAAALCHLSILLNLITYVGGIAFCLVMYLIGLGGARFLAQQAGRALISQALIWGTIGAGWVIYRVLPDWLGGIFFWPFSTLVWFCAILWAIVKALRCL